MRVVPAPAVWRPSSRSRRRSSVSRTPSRLTMLLLRQRGRTGSSDFFMAEKHNAFDPSSQFIRVCQQLRLAAILFELVTIPFLASFHPEAARSHLIGVYVCELLFCADIYVQLNTGYYENGNVLRDARKARRKYLASPGFAADAVALIPLSLVLPSNTTASRSIALLEMHKLVRMWRLPALTSNLDDLYARHFASLKLTKVLGFTLLLTHFVACGRFSFGYDNPAPGEEPNHWLPHAPHEGHHTTRRQYLMSLFWAFGLLTGGFEGELPHHNAEFAFTIVVGLCGFTLFTSLCATFFLLSKCESGDAELAEARVNQFQHILAFHRVPIQLQAQAVDYLQRYHTQTEANDREAARRLCPSISVDIQVELLEATVALVPVFAGCDTLFIRAVARLLELIALPARVALFRVGDHGDAMYIVHTGVLHTVVGGVKVRELRKGNFVGEVAVFARQPRTATVITATYCTLYRLSRAYADKLLEGYPQYAQAINNTVAEMLNKPTVVEPLSSEIPNDNTSHETEPKKKLQLSIVQLVRLKQRVHARALARKNNQNMVDDSANSDSGPPKLDEALYPSQPGTIQSQESDKVKRIAPQPIPLPSHKSKEAGVVPKATMCPRYSSPVPSPLWQASRSDSFHSDSAISSRKLSKHASLPTSVKVFPFVPQAPSGESTASGSRRGSRRTSFLAAGMNKLTTLRDNFFHDNTVRPSDTIQGYYQQFAHLTASVAPRKRWWHRLLMKHGLDAESSWRMAWIAVVIAVNCYNWVLIPLLLSFSTLDGLWTRWYLITLNLLADLVLWIDIYGNFHLSFSANSEKILESTRTAQRYLCSGRFFLDLCCVWPYWIFTPKHFTHPALRVPRLISGYRMHGLVNEVGAYFRLSSKHKLMSLGVLFLMLYHIVACLYFSTTYLDGYSVGEDQWLPSEDVYLQRLNATHFQTISGTVLAADSSHVQEIRAEQYFRSLYYAANVLAAVGRMVEPASDTEYGAALIFMLSGFFITAIVVDHVQKGFTASALEEKEFFAARSRFQRFLKRQNAPLSIHLRVNSFLDFWWSAHRGALIDELLEDLPGAIKRDVVRSICTPAMDSLEMLCSNTTTAAPDIDNEIGMSSNMETSVPTILEQVEEIFLDNIKFVLYGQGEIIYRRGDYAAGIFFLLEGKVSIVMDGEIPRHVPLGGFFGTAALQSSTRDKRGGRRRSSVRLTAGMGYTEHVTAVSGCIVVYISREYLQAMRCILPTLPEDLRKLEQRLHDARVARSSDLRSFQPRVALGGFGLNNPTMRRALRRKQLTGLVQLLSKNLDWWQRGTAIDPDWPFVGVWEATMLMASTVQGALVMFYICFGANETSSGRAFSDAVMVTLELLFVLDAYLHLRLGFYEYGNKVMDLTVIQRRYLRSVHFGIDMAALIPLFIVNWLLPSRRLEILNINKMLRYFKASSQFRTLETKYVKLMTELRLLKLVYYSFLASHIFGCIWFDFAAHKSGIHIVLSGSSDTTMPSFGASMWGPYEQLETAARGLQYLASIFWSYGLMSNSSQGELPKTVGECLFSVITMTTGFFLFAYVVGHISDVIELQDSENRHFVAKLSSLRQLLRHFDLPPSVEEKFKKYFFFKRFHSITQEHVLERVLPPSLVVDMRMFQLKPMIVKVAFLVGMEDSVTRMLVSLFTQVLYVKDEFICHFGEEGSEMFFIYTGVLDIYIPLVSPTNPDDPAVFPTTASGARVSASGLRKVNEITAGSYFGEAALFTNTPRNAYVKANTSCILYKLSRHSLELVFVRYPEWQQKVLRIVKIQQQQQRLQRLAYEAQAPDTGGGGRRRGPKGTRSSIDLVNARAESIERVLLSHQRRIHPAENTPRRIISSAIKQGKKLRAVTLIMRWAVPVQRSLHAIGKQLAHGAEIQSPFYLQWMRLVSISTVYVAVMAPFRLTYDPLDRWNIIPVCLRVLESLCEVVFWVDIWFQFHMCSNQAAMELYEQDQLLAYKRERLALDLAATFPIDHFVASFSSESGRLLLCKWLRLNRCLKVANLVYYRNEITRRSVSYELNRAQTLWLLYLLAMFWTSCAYFAVSIYDGFGTEWQNWLPSSVLDADDPSSELLLLRIFRGLAFAVTAFVKKSRTFVPASQLNFAFTIVISFIGQLIMALMIAEMANVFLLYIDNEVQFRKHHLIVERSLARWKVSTALKRRANNFLTSWWSSHAGVDYQLIFDDLPASVRTEGILTIAKQPLGLFVNRVFRPLFHEGLQTSVENVVDVENREVGLQEREKIEKPDYGARFQLASLTYSIAKCLRFEGYPRGENVIVEGSVCKAMYFVVRGYLLSKSISNKEMYPASRYRGGDYFGEIGLLGHSVSLMTVTSIRACDLFVLNSDQLLQAVQSHPYFSLVLAAAHLAVREKKTTSEFVADWFVSDRNDEDIDNDSDVSDSDDSDGDEEDDGSDKNEDTGNDVKLRRASQQLRSALRGASQEIMDVWVETFALFMEMLVPKGSMSTTEKSIY